MGRSTSLMSYGSKTQGWFFVCLGSILFLVFLYAAIISKFFPVAEYNAATTVKIDRYYCFLVPLTIPILYVAVYFHWLSMKFFKHA